MPMRKIITLLLLVLFTESIIAQCGNGNTLVSGFLTPAGVGQSKSLTFNSGQYVLAYVQGGANYQVSTCGGSTGAGPTYDTQLTIYADATGAFLAYNDDYCGVQSTVNFTPNFCGYVRVLLHQYSCNGSNLPWMVTMTQNTAGSIQTYTLPATATQTNVSCFGAANGMAEVSVTGSTGLVQYRWAPSGGSNARATGLSPGVYTVTVSDAVCQGTKQTYTITEPTALTATGSSTNISCFGGSNGSAQASVSGGTMPYTYTWAPSGGNGATASALAPGNYTCAITDANGCTTTVSTTVSQPASAISSSTAVANALCFGGSTGSATVTAAGGTPGYTYLWSTAATTPVITGQTAGVKTVTVTDANGCTTTNTVTVSEPATAVSSSTAVTNAACFGGSTGSATVTASGGTPGYTYLWSTAATTSVIAGQAAGVRTVTVTDANGCTTSNTVAISQPATAVSFSTAATNVLCFGGSTGSATVTASGGTGAYTYLWSTVATTSVITGQTAGVKTVTVTDANACTAVNSVNIAQPASALSTTTAVANVLCFGNSSGSATVTASGGTAGYTYLWSTAATTSVISGQAAGVKTVTVTDANGCSLTSSVTIAQPASAVSSSTAATHVLCFGNSTAAATVTATGGTAGYTYLWSTGATSAVITGQTAGVKTVTVSDANGCTTTNTVTITQPATGITTATAVTHVLCFGGSTGSATITASGGTGAYAYLWSTAATTPVITGQTAGVKTVTVSDANGCTSTGSVTITQPATAVSSSTAAVNVLCFGNSTGSATITATGGTPGYTYLWSTAATTSVITGQTAGVKTVTVTDANACTTTNTVVVTQPAAGVATATAALNVACFGNSTGSATVTASGGTGAYSYLWSTAATTSVITGQTAGVKTVTVSDANGCTSLNSVSITQPAAALSATQTQTNITCVINGRAAVSASGGTLPYTYTWVPSGGNAATSATLSAGSYTCTTQDANNCTFNNVFTITANTVAPVVAVSGSTAVCNGANAVLAASGANSYSWSTGATTASITVNPSATTVYSVTGTTTANGCTASVTHTLTVNPNPTVTATAASTIICSTQSTTLTAGGATTYTWSTGSNAASIVITPTATTSYTLNGSNPTGCAGSAGISITVVNTPTVTAVSSSTAICAGASATLTAGGASTYSWSTGATTNSIVVSPVAGTTYSVNGMVTAGCNSNATVSLAVNANPTVSIAASSASVCPGQTATLTASGASSYTWSNGSNAASITSVPVVATGYTVTGSNAAGCRNTATQTIGLFPAPAINLINIGSPSTSVCAGSSATLVASGVNTYTWSTGSNNASLIITPAITTTYSVNGTDLNGCAASGSITIGINATPTVSAVASSTGICAGFSATLSAAGASTYVWSNGSTGPSITVNPSGTATYSVAGTNAAGCVSGATVEVTVYASPVVSIGADAELASATGYQLNPSQSGAVSYTWSPATYLSNTSILNPVTTPESDITYILTVSSANGCTASDTVMIRVLSELIIANYMSPNGDGQNDTWKVSVPGLIKDYSVTIIDSYGKTVFSTGSNYNNEFDGKLGGKDLPDGAYYYFIKDGNAIKYKGSITLTK